MSEAPVLDDDDCLFVVMRHFAARTSHANDLAPMDPPLDIGVAQAQASAVVDALRAVRFDAVFTSELTRAIESAALLQHGLGLPRAMIDVSLNELHAISDWRSVTLADVCLLMDRDTRHQVSDSGVIESDDSMMTRVDSFFDRLRGSPRRRILIVTHYNVIRAITQLWNGSSRLDLGVPFRCAYGGYLVLGRSPQGRCWVEKPYDDHHLLPDLLLE